MRSDELGHCIGAWRDRLDPAAAGLPAGVRRRAPGLAREEPAVIAGLSVDHLDSAAADTHGAEALARLAERTLEGVPG